MSVGQFKLRHHRESVSLAAALIPAIRVVRERLGEAGVEVLLSSPCREGLLKGLVIPLTDFLIESLVFGPVVVEYGKRSPNNRYQNAPTKPNGLVAQRNPPPSLSV